MLTKLCAYGWYINLNQTLFFHFASESTCLATKEFLESVGLTDEVGLDFACEAFQLMDLDSSGDIGEIFCPCDDDTQPQLSNFSLYPTA